jgi:L-ascorbate metabolism protein UlaG (beta-lactamase superfamily)
VFKDLRCRIGPVDLALLPIGAYEPRWFMRSVHMNPEEAVRAHMELGSALSVAMHFGTFQLTTEGIDEPALALRRACAEHGIPELQFRVPSSGESIHVR